MKSILVPVNFSDCASNAARYAADLAAALHAQVHLLHVVQIPLTSAEMAMTEDLYNRILDSADEGLKELQREMLARTSGQVKVQLHLQTGNLTAVVGDICRTICPDLIVLGLTAQTFEKFLAGSPVHALLHLRHALLVVPDQAGWHPYRTIALACDESDVNRGVPHSLPLLQELQQRFHAKIEMITVETSEVLSNEACGYELGETRPMSALNPTRHYVRTHSVLQGLEEWLSSRPADLAVVFPKHHSLLEFHSSPSRALARNGRIPILSLPE